MPDGKSTAAIQRVEEGDVFDLLPQLEADSAHAAIVDYPWEFNGRNGTGRFQSSKDDDREFNVYNTEDSDGMVNVLEELSRILTGGSWVFVFADDDTEMEFRTFVEESSLTYRRTLVWDREKFGMGVYHRVQHYPILAATNGDTDRYVSDRGTVFQALKHDGAVSHDWDQYPTGKPVKLYRQMLESPVINEGERLIEPFCGYAPGAAVASERHIGYWGADINPDAVVKAREQLEQTRLDQQMTLSMVGGHDV